MNDTELKPFRPCYCYEGYACDNCKEDAGLDSQKTSKENKDGT